jgi:hypothetical protein
MRGMVKGPIVKMFATTLPVIIPTRELVTTADIAGPDLHLFPNAFPTSMKKPVAPEVFSNVPKITNRKI